MLPSPQNELWNTYQDLERQLLRSEMMSALDRFVESILELPAEQWHKWAWQLCRRVVDKEVSIKVRFPLFRQVLFPALLIGMKRQLPGCARWMAGFSRLLYQSENCRQQLPEDQQSEIGLLQASLKLDQNDSLSRRKLIIAFVYEFEYALHEVPAGVLWGNTGATVEQCQEFGLDLDQFRNLTTSEGLHEEHAPLIEECNLHFNAYAGYRADESSYESYWDYLEKNHQGWDSMPEIPE